MFQVMPSHAVVQRCSGGCSTALHTCQAQVGGQGQGQGQLVLQGEIFCNVAKLVEVFHIEFRGFLA